MAWLAKFEDWLTRPRRLLLLGIATFGFSLAMSFLLGAAGISASELIQLEITFSPNEFRSLLVSWGADGREAFLAHYWLDFVFPVIYALFLSSLFATSLGPRPPEGRPRRELFFLLLPLFAGFCDWIENIVDLTGALHPELLTDSLINVGASFSRAKWSAAIICVVAAAAELLKRQFAPMADQPGDNQK